MSEVSLFLALIATVASGTAVLSVNNPPEESQPGPDASALTSIPVGPRYHGLYEGIFIDAQVEGAELSFLVDTGATLTILSEKDARSIGITTNGTRIIKGIGGPVTATKASVDITVNGQAIDNLEVAVVKNVPHSLLGLDAINHLGKPRLTFE